MRRTAALLGLATLLAACDTAPLEPAAPADAPETAAAAAVEWSEVSYELLNVLPVECLGESVALTGPVVLKTRQVVDATGAVHLFLRFESPDIQATGLTSGNVWTAKMGLELFSYAFRPDGSPQRFGHEGVIRLAGEGPLPELILKHFYQVVVDPSGEVRVERSTPDEFTCHYTGQDEAV